MQVKSNRMAFDKMRSSEGSRSWADLEDDDDDFSELSEKGAEDEDDELDASLTRAKNTGRVKQCFSKEGVS